MELENIEFARICERVFSAGVRTSARRDGRGTRTCTTSVLHGGDELLAIHALPKAAHSRSRVLCNGNTYPEVTQKSVGPPSPPLASMLMAVEWQACSSRASLKTRARVEHTCPNLP